MRARSTTGIRPLTTAVKVAAAYAALGIAWILFSDWVLPQWTDLGQRRWFQTAKGSLYVLVTAGLALLLVWSELRRVGDAQRSTSEGEEKFRAMASSAQDGVILIDDAGRVQYWNPAAETLFGYGAEEMLGREYHQLLVTPELRQAAREGLSRFAGTGDGPVVGRALELRAVHRDGGEIPVELSVSAVHLDGRWHAVGIVRDIRARDAWRRELEAKQRQVEQAHRDWLETVDAIGEPLFTHDAEGRVLRANRAYAERAGLPVTEVLGRPYWELFPPGEGPLPESRRLLEEPAVQETREDVELEDGTVFSVHAFAVRDDAGDFRYVVQVLEDVSAQRQAERTLLHSRRVFRSLVERSPVAMLLLERGGGVLFVNQAAADLVGESRADALVGRRVAEFVVPEEHDAVGGALTRVFEGEEPVTRVEFRVHRADGSRAEVEAAGIRIDYEGAPAALTIVHDMTERKRSEQALVHERERARQYLDIAGAILVALDAEGRIELINRRGCEILGYTESELVGKDWFGTCLPESVREEVHAVAERVWAGELEPVERFENPVLTRSGEERLVAWHNSVLRDAEGRIIGTLSSGEDVTEQRRAEAVLERQNRALRTLSACNEALVRARDEDRLLHEVCRVLVEEGGYPLAWVGYAEDDAERSVRPVARWGEGAEYVDEIRVHWSEDELGRGPTGTAIRTGAVQRAGDPADESDYLPWRDQALAHGFACSIALPLPGEDGMFGALNIYSGEPEAFDEAETELLQELAADLAFGIRARRSEVERRRVQERHREAMLQTVQAIARTVEIRDPYTAGHQERVAELAVAIAEAMGLSPSQCEGIRLGSLIHDLGKINIPAEILTRPGGLSEVEYGLIKVHPQNGYEIVKDVHTPWPLAEMILQHHERLDGSGYPQGLTADEIIPEARILAVADVVEAMASHRPYRPAVGIDKATEVIREGRGLLFDPEVVDTCLELIEKRDFRFTSYS